MDKRELFNKYFTITDRTGEVIQKYPGEVNGNDFKISNLSECQVHLLDVTDRLLIDNVTRSTLFIGPCKETVILRNVTDSKIVLACKEIRVSNCETLRINVFTQQNIILEESKNIILGKFNGGYSGLTSQFLSANLSVEKQERNDFRVTDFSKDAEEGGEGGEENLLDTEETEPSITTALNYRIVEDAFVEGEDELLNGASQPWVIELEGAQGRPENPVSSLQVFQDVEENEPPKPTNLPQELAEYLYPDEASMKLNTSNETTGSQGEGDKVEEELKVNKKVAAFVHWRNERLERIQTELAAKKETMKAAAEEELEEFYDKRTKEISLRVAKNREEEEKQRKEKKEEATSSKSDGDAKEFYQRVLTILKKDPDYQKEYSMKKRMIDLIAQRT